MRLARGITLVEVLAVILVIALAVGVILPAFGGSHPARPLKDATQVGQIEKAMVIWSESNAEHFPLPSLVDHQNETIADLGRAKDSTANIYSMLVFQGMITPEILVSPLETNPHVGPCESYEYESPRTAVDPSKALWDPRFSVTLDGSRPGNASYAHLQPSGDRANRYTSALDPAVMILGTRGPEIVSVKQNPDGAVIPTLTNPKSYALRFFGKGRSWSGNIAFNDNHVEFLNDWLTPGKRFKHDRTYTAADGKQRSDIWCYDEPDDPKAANDFLGIFLKAGEEPKDFKAAWD